MKRLLSVLLLCSFFLTACLVQDEEKIVESPKMHISEPLAQVSYCAAFNKDDCALAKEFDRILGEVIEDGTAARLCDTHTKRNYVPDEPLPASIGKAKGEDDSLDLVREKGELVIGYHKQYPPAAWTDSSQNAVGFDAELAEEVCRRMGLKAKFTPLDWKNKENALSAGKVNVILCAFERTEEHLEKFNLSRTYFDTNVVLLSLEKTPYNSLDQLTKKRVAFCEGTYSEQLLNGVEATLMPCSTYKYAYERVVSKQYAAMLADEAYALYITGQ